MRVIPVPAVLGQGRGFKMGEQNPRTRQAVKAGEDLAREMMAAVSKMPNNLAGIAAIGAAIEALVLKLDEQIYPGFRELVIKQLRGDTTPETDRVTRH